MHRAIRLNVLLISGGLLVLSLACGTPPPAEESPDSVTASAPDPGDPDGFVFDPTWPKPLPDNWTLGNVVGVAVDARDHIWVLHRPGSLTAEEAGAAASPPLAECCRPAPPVIEFNQVGDVVQAWGGPGDGYEWPQSEHGIFIDHLDNVWLGGSGGADAQVLKFTRDGDFLLQIGRQGQSQGSNDLENFGQPTSTQKRTRSTSPMGMATAGLRSSTPTPASIAATGAPTATRPPTTPTPTTRTRHRRSNLAGRSTAQRCRRMVWSTSATG